ncbi:MAG: mRNA interferase YafQ [Candidatus Scalindua rubra]|uniref:mRNA interferase YafQ n=1 Tax=Candidatus Scalindua rubra TaxID=1872076 RepID=A0A1E3X475_9BACT|nr:MAG: mRNA interferase YafQ [Candidatus Scalindua rubra]
MLKPIYTRQFAKDLKKMQKPGKSPKKIKNIMDDLVNEIPLDVKHRDHKLIGYYKGRRECHVEADWLLIYKATEKEIIFERTGTHSDLFD